MVLDLTSPPVSTGSCAMALFELTRGRIFSLLLGTVCALGLFFGLFFGLIYPEIVRQYHNLLRLCIKLTFCSGWPLTRYTVLDSRINERFCCEAKCDKGCVDVPSEAATCRQSRPPTRLVASVDYLPGSITSQIDSQSTPQGCAANSSSCPALSGPCDGG